MNIPILSTKLFIPEPRKELVVRSRLFNELNAGCSKELMLVSAPAGFGKSTLISSWVAGNRKRAAWLALDKDDNQAVRFLNYLIAALQKLDNQIGEQAAHLLAANSLISPEAVLTSLINDLQSVRSDIFLVLDDFHFIDNADIIQAITFILDHCPGLFHLIIITRSDPQLPLARLRARAQMAEIREADLRFTDQEAAQFLNDVMGLHLETGMVAALEERTEGWIAGLQMAALSISRREDIGEFIADFSGSNRYIMDYLLEEVLKNLPGDIQQFLLYTSILRRLNAGLCDILLAAAEKALNDDGVQTINGDHPPTGRSGSMLEFLDSRNIFLIALDEERSWYRYHDLFADMLRNRLHEQNAGMIPLLHMSASAWLEQQGSISEAIHHLLAAGEHERAATLIERYGPERFSGNDPSILQMAEHLPGGMVLDNPKIGLYLIWLFIVQGRINKARPLINDLDKQLSSSDPVSNEKWIRTIVKLADAFLTSSPQSQVQDHLPEYDLLEEIPAGEKILRNTADYLYAMTLARLDDLENAASVALESLKRENLEREVEAIPTLAPFLSRIYLIQGYLAKCAALCREYLTQIKQADHPFIYASGNMKIDLGEVHYERNNLADAETLIREGLKSNELWRNIMTDCFGLAALTRVLIARGDFTDALRTVELFEARLQDPMRPRDFEEDFLTLKVRVQLAAGDLEATAAWADQVRHRVDYETQKGFYALTLAQVRLVQGRYPEIEELLSGQALPPATASQLSREIERGLLLAAAAAGQGHEDKAVGLLENCLAMAEPDGYLHDFLDTGEPVRELLTAYLKTGSSAHRAYAQKVLDAFETPKQAGHDAVQQDGLIEPLSERELEVLRLMADGKTNKEIAAQLFITAGTVKAHTSNIYRKLNVENRTEAASRARQIDLLSLSAYPIPDNNPLGLTLK